MESIKCTREEVSHFLSIKSFSESDYGHGYGSDYGHGFGYGSACGIGDYNGYGYGNGFDNGSGSGYDSCDGTGFGSGSGIGYGSANGHCEGYIIKIFCGCNVNHIDDIPTIITQIRGNIAKGYILKGDLTIYECYVAKVGNSFAHGRSIHDALRDAEAKELKNVPVKERVDKFIDVFGDLDSKHTGKEFYDWHHILTGSCTMGRDGFCKEHGIDMEKLYTVRYFLNITKDSYGQRIIKQIIKKYGKHSIGLR